MILIAFLFIVQLVSVYLIVLLFMRINQLKQVEQKQKRMMTEMEDAISAYLVEVREENDRLIDALTNQPFEEQEVDQQQQSSSIVKESKEELLEYDIQEDEEELVKKAVTRHHAIQSYGKHIHTKDQPITQEEDVFSLREAGYTVEEIAQKLNKGKTEVELMIKFATK